MLVVAVAAPWFPAVFSGDHAVQDLGTQVLLVVAVLQPLAAVVFVLDGVLIGAGDGAFLAWAGLVVLAAYAPAALWAATLPHGLVAVWVAMTVVFMGARGVLLSWRARSDHWLVTGAPSRR
jgi:Na+-driven multidrug efflux pump